MTAWDHLLTAQDRAAIEWSVFGGRRGFGRRPAVLVVDATYAFVGTREPLADSVKRYPYSSGRPAWQAVEAIRRLLDAARPDAVPVIYTRSPSGAPDGTAGPHWRLHSPDSGASSGPTRPDDDDSIVAEIAPQPGDLLIDKTRPSAFFGTTLASTLVELRVDSLLVCGGTTSGCVRATVVDAFSYNYDVSVVEDGTFDRFQASHGVALFDLHCRYADVVTLAQAVQHLRTVRIGRS